ncbi:MAG: glutathione-disulfide reductase [Albidovulum sp.]|nr:glutathione-disulfide reductase [Albidovulum sp.]
MFEFDLFVIGGGSGGVRAARMAAEAGAKVALAEEYRLGGTCVIRGCVPKKLMVYASNFSHAFASSKGFGWVCGEARFEWKSFKEAKDREIARLEGIYGQLLQSSGVAVFKSRAVLDGAHAVHLSNGTRIGTRHILVATGGAPQIPSLPGSEYAISSNEVFKLEELPRSVLIVGGGYIACEFACILNGMGCRVVQFYRGPKILRGFDEEVREHLGEAIIRRGVDIQVETDVKEIQPRKSGYSVIAKDGRSFEFDRVMFATGRRPATDGLGLEEAGVRIGTRGEIEVDQYSQSTVPSIFAVGDVTNRVNLTPVAIREGAAFVETVFKGNPTPVDHKNIATAVFTQAELGTVGLTEEEGRKRGGVQIYATKFKPLSFAISGNEERSLMKLVVDSASRRVLGVHIVGESAAEMIQLAAVAVKMGATKEDFDRTVAVHPTAAEELVTFRDPVRAT